MILWRIYVAGNNIKVRRPPPKVQS